MQCVRGDFMMRSTLAMAIATVLVGSMAIEPLALAQQPSMQPATQELSNQELSNQEGVGPALDGSQGDNVSQSQQHEINRSDEKFLQDFAQANAAGVGKGDLAAWKSENAEVKAFATQIMETNSTNIDKVKTIATEARVDVKAKPDFMQRTKAAFLDISVGDSFDRAYLKAMINDHEEIIKMLEREIKDGQDANVKHLAVEALSDAQQRLLLARELRARVLLDQNASRSLPRSDASGAEKVAATR
jgi:putative membrane protein